jgi:hypothetical protein
VVDELRRTLDELKQALRKAAREGRVHKSGKVNLTIVSNACSRDSVQYASATQTTRIVQNDDEIANPDKKGGE